MAVVRMVHEIEHRDVDSYRIFLHAFTDIDPQEWNNQASTTLEDAMGNYMVEVIAESNM